MRQFKFELVLCPESAITGKKLLLEEGHLHGRNIKTTIWSS
jgi:hypothetical protein